MTTPAFDAIILAAQREGRLDPLAAGAGVSHKCLVPIGGRPLLAHVLEAMAGVEGLARIRISVEPAAEPALRKILPELVSGVSRSGSPREPEPGPGDRATSSGTMRSMVEGPPVPSPQTPIPIEFVASRPTITDSVYAAAEGLDGPFIVTTADNVLLTAGAVRRVVDRLRAGDDAVGALSRKEDVLSAHPQGQRRFYRFTDGFYSNCNLYGMSRAGLRLAETYRQGGQFAKNPLRILRAIGLINLIILRYGLLPLDRAMNRLGRRFGVRASAVVLEDGAHAIDVDNARTYDIAALLLEKRAA